MITLCVSVSAGKLVNQLCTTSQLPLLNQRTRMQDPSSRDARRLPYLAESRTDALPHFERLGFVPERETNPMDFMIDLSSVDARDDDREAQSRARVDRLVAAWREKTKGDELATSAREKPEDKVSSLALRLRSQAPR